MNKSSSIYLFNEPCSTKEISAANETRQKEKTKSDSETDHTPQNAKYPLKSNPLKTSSTEIQGISQDISNPKPHNNNKRKTGNLLCPFLAKNSKLLGRENSPPLFLSFLDQTWCSHIPQLC